MKTYLFLLFTLFCFTTVQGQTEIAAGYTTPAAVVNGWMMSPGHCMNIMSGNFKEIGVGYAYNSMSSYKHYWTQDFGRRS